MKSRIHLYVHAVWAVEGRRGLLGRTVRVVLFSHLRKTAEEKGIRILAVGGAEEHMHVLVQLHPAQNLAQVVRQLKSESSDWLNATKVVGETLAWEEDYLAFSVSPNVIRQVTEYLEKQDEYHKKKSLDEELELFEKLQSGSAASDTNTGNP
jgi:REP element-mobilizing transposase RayT